MKPLSKFNSIQITVRLRPDQRGFFLAHSDLNASEFIRKAIDERIKKWKDGE